MNEKLANVIPNPYFIGPAPPEYFGQQVNTDSLESWTPYCWHLKTGRVKEARSACLWRRIILYW
jgi:hypothetical protein